MLDMTIVDDLIDNNTAHELRAMLLHYELGEEDRAHIIAAINYMEGTDYID